MKQNGKIADLFAAVLELNPAERAVFLEKECGGDSSVRSEIEELLRAYEQAQSNSFLSASAIELEAKHFAGEEIDSRVGQTFGHYKILEKIGAGGMGAIYLAERDDDAFHKKVAVKIIKRGMDTDAILRRFRNERQILANLEHPNIARLLDGGTTEDGLPFLVTEFVEGLPIDKFCRTNNLSEREKIALFRTVCSAVAFAHRNLVVHRDLKPSNILVTAEGEPKLLDFGIAKLVGEAESEIATHTHLRVTTPAYASPEQTAGKAITTATDVYSLGVILHELLTGKRPLSCVSSQPSVENGGGQMTRDKGLRLKGELRNIVAQALRTEPERRYSSVAIARKYANPERNGFRHGSRRHRLQRRAA